MTSLVALWLPILLSAVFVFIASSIIHMAPLWHKNDYPRVANQDQILGALRPLAIPPGDYFLPRAADMKDMRSPEFKEKAKAGPMVLMTVIPFRGFSMTRPLSMWFIFVLITSFLSAYVAGVAFPPGASREAIARVISTVAFIGYGLALWEMSIWYSRSWTMTIKSTIDALIYGLITAATFVWLWPR